MKVSVFSDLHIEFENWKADSLNSDLIILAGDIHTKHHGVLWAKESFEAPVLYVPGNHEFYGGNIQSITRKMHAAAQGSNIRVLDNDSFLFNDVLFIGATLWTDFKLFENKQSYSKEVARTSINDFNRIRVEDSGRYRKLTPEDTITFFNRSVQFIESQLKRIDVTRKVVISHHAPSVRSENPKYINSVLSPAFISDLEQLILDYQPELWIHGHTHHSVDYKIGKTRVVSNQKGYPDESTDAFNSDHYIYI